MTTSAPTSAYAEDPFFDGEALLRIIATAVVQLSQQRVPGEAVYPDAVQAAYNQLVLQCLRRGVEPPASVPDMARWAAWRPLGDWPLALPDDLVAADRYLVDRGTGGPTQHCFEWAISARDPAAEQFENQLIEEALTRCRTASAPESYTAFRRLLTERPVLTGTDIALLGGELDLGLLHETIKRSYGPAPASYRREGRYTQCARCHCLLVPVDRTGWRCELDRCRRDGLAAPGCTLDARAGGEVYQLSRPLRMFVTSPGLAEIDLETELVRLGLDVEMWPNFDAYDLRVTLPEGDVWAIDVKDRANPALLGRTARPLPPAPAYDRAFLVAPRYRFADREDYGRVFAHHQPDDLRGRLELLSDDEMLRRAAAASRRTRRRKEADDA